MKAKLIQIVLGAIGSVVALLIQYVAAGAVDPALTVAGGMSANAVLGDVAQKLVS